MTSLIVGAEPLPGGGKKHLHRPCIGNSPLQTQGEVGRALVGAHFCASCALLEIREPVLTKMRAYGTGLPGQKHCDDASNRCVSPSRGAVPAPTTFIPTSNGEGAREQSPWAGCRSTMYLSGLQLCRNMGPGFPNTKFFKRNWISEFSCEMTWLLILDTKFCMWNK